MAAVKFKDVLARIAQRFPSKRALAIALDLEPSRLSRAINQGDFPFNIENCLRLASIAGESPAAILSAAGKADIAALIESLYGPEKTITDPTLKHLLAHWSTFTPDEKTFVRVSVNILRPRKTPLENK